MLFSGRDTEGSIPQRTGRRREQPEGAGIPGTYYVSVTEGDLVLAREEEVQVGGNTTRIYKRTNWEKQLRILTETCDIWSSNEVFSFDISQPICRMVCWR